MQINSSNPLFGKSFQKAQDAYKSNPTLQQKVNAQLPFGGNQDIFMSTVQGRALHKGKGTGEGPSYKNHKHHNNSDR